MAGHRRASTTARLDDSELNVLATQSKPEEQRPTTALDPRELRGLLVAATPGPDDEDRATRAIKPLIHATPPPGDLEVLRELAVAPLPRLKTGSPVDPPARPERVAVGSSLEIVSFATDQVTPLAVARVATLPTLRRRDLGLPLVVAAVILAIGGAVIWLLLT